MFGGGKCGRGVQKGKRHGPFFINYERKTRAARREEDLAKSLLGHGTNERADKEDEKRKDRGNFGLLNEGGAARNRQAQFQEFVKERRVAAVEEGKYQKFSTPTCKTVKGYLTRKGGGKGKLPKWCEKGGKRIL